MCGVLTAAVIWWFLIQCVGDVLTVWYTGWNIFRYLIFPLNVYCTVHFNPLPTETTAYFWIVFMLIMYTAFWDGLVSSFSAPDYDYPSSILILFFFYTVPLICYLLINGVKSASRLVSKVLIKVLWLSGKPRDNMVIVNWSAIF